ncbi:hypothetical protein [Fimbriimonas ginsengisoli]|uniref:Uncharacterized protein n=1 Tax=Fimbriimonas ginsengisoli Gsoil 348 TaxID=661478 RepID=A0A068NXC1_FIMGI|nr:hypothetical protein [Fimbriimonas ginsengisoli]AIE88173.1 hypothetical protein OP10G_4805 [Fimbriimonas ginsengisoli Gsoil 348]
MPNPFGNVVYIQIRRRWVSIRLLGWSGRLGEWSGVPEVVFGQDGKGREHAYLPDDPRATTTIRPRAFIAFAHPRVVLDGFDDTVAALRIMLKLAGVPAQMVARTTYLLHIRDEWFGGVSDVERRALIEMAKWLGAGRVLFVDSPTELSPPEVLALVRSPQAQTGSSVPLAGGVS